MTAPAQHGAQLPGGAELLRGPEPHRGVAAAGDGQERLVRVRGDGVYVGQAGGSVITKLVKLG